VYVLCRFLYDISMECFGCQRLSSFPLLLGTQEDGAVVIMMREAQPHESAVVGQYGSDPFSSPWMRPGLTRYSPRARSSPDCAKTL
jgi:hypothetical protein